MPADNFEINDIRYTEYVFTIHTYGNIFTDQGEGRDDNPQRAHHSMHFWRREKPSLRATKFCDALKGVELSLPRTEAHRFSWKFGLHKTWMGHHLQFSKDFHFTCKFDILEWFYIYKRIFDKASIKSEYITSTFKLYGNCRRSKLLCPYSCRPLFSLVTTLFIA